jgi:Subtilase family
MPKIISATVAPLALLAGLLPCAPVAVASGSSAPLGGSASAPLGASASAPLGGSASVPLGASAYHVRPVCGTPAPRQAHCLALELVPSSAAARAYAHPLGLARGASTGASRAAKVCEPPKAAERCFGLLPGDLQSAYFPGVAPEAPAAGTQTIALVDAYDDASAEADLETYDKEFGLPPCTQANGCFKKINQEGQAAPLPPSFGKQAKEWAGEIATDLEVAHAVCQNCHIMLVEASSAAFVNLAAAEETAVKLEANEISNSWGIPEEGIDSPAFNHPDIAITASAGDSGYLDWGAENPEERGLPDYPASSPHVIAVGGTRLTLNGSGAWQGETVWNGEGAGGGGCSASFAAQPWQPSLSDWSAVGCGPLRASADVAADADPFTGVAVYGSTVECEYEEGKSIITSHWCPIGGTSVASPIIAAMFALAGGAHGVEYPARTLYENLAAAPGSLHDVVTGSNGQCLKPPKPDGSSGCTSAEEAASCSGELSCLAAPGYDGPTGVGTPNGLAAFVPPAKPSGTPGPGAGNPEGSGGAGGPASGAGGSGGGPPPGGVASPGTTSSPSAAQPGVVLSALALTRSAIVALDTARPKIARVSFAFTLSAATRVQATLARWTRVRGRWRWKTLPVTRTIAAKRGRNRSRLTSQGTLAPGRYRLTLTPAGGRARSIVFQIG